MKRIHDTNRTTELFIKAGLTAAITGALVLPVSIKANGADATGLERAAFTSQPLPPIPRLDTMPWLVLERPHGALKTDILLMPESPQSLFARSAAPIWLSSGMSSLAHKNTNG